MSDPDELREAISRQERVVAEILCGQADGEYDMAQGRLEELQEQLREIEGDPARDLERLRDALAEMPGRLDAADVCPSVRDPEASIATGMVVDRLINASGVKAKAVTETDRDFRPIMLAASQQVFAVRFALWLLNNPAEALRVIEGEGKG